MANNFVSDFSLFPIKKLGKPGWAYKKATWPMEIEPEVHKLYNDEIPGPIYYNRLKLRDNTMERCKICKCGDDIHVEPGNGWDYLVRIDSLNNVVVDIVNAAPNGDDVMDNPNALQQLDCVICLTNKRTHIIKDCSHFVMCQECSINVFNNDKKCPMCRCEMKVPAKKVFF
jgi:hypothetical protein